MVASDGRRLTVAFAIADVARRDAARSSVVSPSRAVGTVVAQGLLGGLTVIFLLPPAVSSAHACLAQAFLCITVALAVLTGPEWVPATRRRPIPRFARLTVATAATVYGQLILGAVMRHTGAGLAIPDFPLALRPRRSALRVGGGGDPLPASPRRARRHDDDRRGSTIRTLQHPRSGAHARAPCAPRRSAWSALQVTLGALTIWTRKPCCPTTAHVATGAAILRTTVAWRSAPATPAGYRRAPVHRLARHRTGARVMPALKPVEDLGLAADVLPLGAAPGRRLRRASPSRASSPMCVAHDGLRVLPRRGHWGVRLAPPGGDARRHELSPAAGTMTLNQYLERDLDAQMLRTRQRPLPDGRVAPADALLFGARAHDRRRRNSDWPGSTCCRRP